LEGDFDFGKLAKLTPGYVGADLAALTGAAGVIAVKRIFQQLSQDGVVASTLTDQDQEHQMIVDPLPLTTATATPRPNSITHFLAAHPAPLTPLQLSPLYITSSDFTDALSSIQPSCTREGFSTIPDVSWSDIGALHATREELHMAIVLPIRNPDVFRKVGITAPCGVLLWGPPGCGKTLLAKAVASESRANFISVKGPELLNKVRDSSASLHRSFLKRW
jgi:ribosome biogenesis ATPase